MPMEQCVGSPSGFLMPVACGDFGTHLPSTHLANKFWQPGRSSQPIAGPAEGEWLCEALPQSSSFLVCPRDQGPSDNSSMPALARAHQRLADALKKEAPIYPKPSSISSSVPAANATTLRAFSEMQEARTMQAQQTGQPRQSRDCERSVALFHRQLDHGQGIDAASARLSIMHLQGQLDQAQDAGAASASLSANNSERHIDHAPDADGTSAAQTTLIVGNIPVRYSLEEVGLSCSHTNGNGTNPSRATATCLRIFSICSSMSCSSFNTCRSQYLLCVGHRFRALKRTFAAAHLRLHGHLQYAATSGPCLLQ